MTAPAAALTGLRRQRPEWHPWLDVIEVILREIETSAWDRSVPDQVGPVAPRVPRLDGVALEVPENAIHRLFKRLVRTASRSGTPEMATLAHVTDGDADALNVFMAALCHDVDRLTGQAAALGADTNAFQAVAALLPVPFLQACNRRWASLLPKGWVEPYCPVCGCWPAFAEVRGIERTRHYRCGRCGAEWHAHDLSCPFCGTTDHEELLTLVPDQAGASAVINACRQCRGYVKAFNRLQGCQPGAAMLEDLGSVTLDVAALEEGYTRPAGAGYRLHVTVSNRRVSRRFLEWNT